MDTELSQSVIKKTLTDNKLFAAAASAFICSIVVLTHNFESYSLKYQQQDYEISIKGQSYEMWFIIPLLLGLVSGLIYTKNSRKNLSSLIMVAILSYFISIIVMIINSNINISYVWDIILMFYFAVLLLPGSIAGGIIIYFLQNLIYKSNRSNRYLTILILIVSFTHIIFYININKFHVIYKPGQKIMVYD